MRILEKTITSFLLFFFLFTSPSTADIKSNKIRSDKRPMILFEKFGFTHTGTTTVAVSNVSVTNTPDPSRQGFFLVSEESVIQVLHELQQNPNFCILDSKYISLLFTFQDLSPPPHSSFNHSYPVTNPNEYSLFFANCQPESLVTMDVRIEQFNMQGDKNNYLSIVEEESLIQVLLELQQNPYFCVVYSRFISLLFTFRDLSPPPQTYPGEYSLFFANCNPESAVTKDVHTELFNTDNGATKDYLSSGLTQLPSLYIIFFILYLCFLGFWINVCFRNRRSVHHLHLLMGVLLIMKTLSLFCAAVDKNYVKVTGTPHGWNVLFYIFEFINTVLSFIVIVLISSGWPYLKSFLLEKEKKVLMIVIPLQVLANIASIVIGETGPFNKDWVTWNLVFLLADFICCCAVVFPIVWSMRSFSKMDVKSARNLKVLRVFCVAVIGYLLFTRIGVFVLKTIVDYKVQWACSASEELARIVFYLVMFCMLRPVDDVVRDEGGDYEEAAELVKG